jgi:hypothetical protein
MTAVARQCVVVVGDVNDPGVQRWIGRRVGGGLVVLEEYQQAPNAGLVETALTQHRVGSGQGVSFECGPLTLGIGTETDVVQRGGNPEVRDRSLGQTGGASDQH